MNGQRKMIKEEQKILNELIGEIDRAIIKENRDLSYEKLQAKKAKDQCLPESYGMLVTANHNRDMHEKAYEDFQKARNELYYMRLKLSYNDLDSQEIKEDEFKVGVHSCIVQGDSLIYSWKAPVCRPFLLDSSGTKADVKVGILAVTHYDLRMKRKIDMRFDKVKQVTQVYPIIEDQEQIIADEFLNTLVSRRNETEFRNIIFSIQKHQGEIIQMPLKTNMIVQGCAGSGKSMIMLHRLPIILFDNDSLDRKGIYIITPSTTYIRLADSMRADLEINDLKMGTLNQYYDQCIKKYNIRNVDNYGIIKKNLKIDNDKEREIYSKSFIEKIQEKYNNILTAIKKYEYAGMLLGEKEVKLKDTDSYSQRVRQKILLLQRVLDKNDKIIDEYVKRIQKVADDARALENQISNNKRNIIAYLNRKIERNERNVRSQQTQMQKIKQDTPEYENKKKLINGLKNNTKSLQEKIDVVDANTDYFAKLDSIIKLLRLGLNLFRDAADKYDIVNKKDYICTVLNQAINKVLDMEELYTEYGSKVKRYAVMLEESVNILMQYTETYLSNQDYMHLSAAQKEISEINNNAVDNIYKEIMREIDPNLVKEKCITALTCSPYIYLQCLYNYYGEPNAEKDSLITIDEAQNIAPEELRLIRNINGKKVIFNLFGDEKQHIEGSKGIDSWGEFNDIEEFERQDIYENYRNAEQITEYCNRCFGLNMKAINIEGTGVDEIDEYEKLKIKLKMIFQEKQEDGLGCIIVKNIQEAQAVKNIIGNYGERINDLTNAEENWKNMQWSLMTVDQASGLEFNTVYALSGRMSNNEKYIAYTRALDRLCVYDKEISVKNVNVDKGDINESAAEEERLTEAEPERKKRKNKHTEQTLKMNETQTVKEFFESKSLNVMDMRNEGGFLWLIGEREELEGSVNEAIDLYGIQGQFSRGKAIGDRNGWYTKTKK